MHMYMYIHIHTCIYTYIYIYIYICISCLSSSFRGISGRNFQQSALYYISYINRQYGRFSRFFRHKRAAQLSACTRGTGLCLKFLKSQLYGYLVGNLVANWALRISTRGGVDILLHSVEPPAAPWLASAQPERYSDTSAVCHIWCAWPLVSVHIYEKRMIRACEKTCSCVWHHLRGYCPTYHVLDRGQDTHARTHTHACT